MYSNIDIEIWTWCSTRQQQGAISTFNDYGMGRISKIGEYTVTWEKDFAILETSMGVYRIYKFEPLFIDDSQSNSHLAWEALGTYWKIGFIHMGQKIEVQICREKKTLTCWY
jgi:hypothetical protein